MRHARPLLWLKIGEIVTDGVLLLLASYLAYTARIAWSHCAAGSCGVLSSELPLGVYLQESALAVPMVLVFLGLSGRYALRGQGKMGAMSAAMSGGLVFSVLVVLFFFFQREIFYSRAIVLMQWGLSSGLLLLSHLLWESCRRNLYRSGRLSLKTLIVGSDKVADEVTRELQERGDRLQPCAALAPYGGARKTLGGGVPVIGKLDALGQALEDYEIDAIYQTEAVEQSLNLLIFAESHGLEYVLSPHLLGSYDGQLVGGSVAGRGALRLKSLPLFGWGQVLKRGMDLAVSVPLCVLLLPALLLGSYEERRARGPHRDTYLQKSLPVLGRASGLGALWNVLKGEMSLIGPRPLSPEERSERGMQERRVLLIRAGMITPERDDEAYVRHWSFWGDMRILLRYLLGGL